MKKILSLFAVLSLATACIYPYQPDLEEAPEGVLVVDGNLMIGEKSVVRIGFMTSLWPKTTQPTSGLPGYFGAKAAGYGNGIRVWAEDDAGGRYEGAIDQTEMNNPYSSSYYYYYSSPNVPYAIDLTNAPADRNYRVCVTAGENDYSSDWIKPLAAPTIKDITFKASKPSDKADVTVSVSLDGGPDATGYVLLSYEETWLFHADYNLEYEYDPRTNEVSERRETWDRFWCWKHLDNKVQIPVDMTTMSTNSLKDYPFHNFSRYDSRNHRRYSILLKARTIDKTTYQYLSHLEESTEAGDNLFTPNPGEISGNLRCENEPDRMVLGYVTVTMATSKRVYNGGQYYLSKYLSPYDLAYPPPTPTVPGGTCYRDFYNMGYMPLIENHLPESDADLGPYGWGPAYCYDCIAAGGTQTRPDFWED